MKAMISILCSILFSIPAMAASLACDSGSLRLPGDFIWAEPTIKQNDDNSFSINLDVTYRSGSGKREVLSYTFNIDNSNLSVNGKDLLFNDGNEQIQIAHTSFWQSPKWQLNDNNAKLLSHITDVQGNKLSAAPELIINTP